MINFELEIECPRCQSKEVLADSTPSGKLFCKNCNFGAYGDQFFTTKNPPRPTGSLIEKAVVVDRLIKLQEQNNQMRTLIGKFKGACLLGSFDKEFREMVILEIDKVLDESEKQK